MNTKRKTIKIIISLIIIILVIIIGAFFTYKNYFAPTVSVTPINSTIEVNPLDLAIKLIPNNIELSSGELKATSSIKLTENNLTDFAILALQQNQRVDNIVQGLKFFINNNTLTLYVQFKYDNIPLEAKLNFSCISENGQAILHYESGKIGFINIPANMLFKYLSSNDYITISSSNRNIAINLNKFKNISISKFNIENNILNIGLEANLNLF